MLLGLGRSLLGRKKSSGIVFDGLVLNLDAGDVSSYPGTGTTWYDISGKGNNGTLTNGPTYDSANKGSIVFDGVDDYVDVSNTSFGGEFTFSCWFKISTKTGVRIIFGSSGGSVSGGPKIGFDEANYFIRIVGVAHSSTTSPAINTWTNMTIKRNSQNKVDFYRNGENETRLFSDAAQVGTFTLDKIGANGADSSQDFYGSIATIHAYNRALSSTEVLQNFNALRSRYGI